MKKKVSSLAKDPWPGFIPPQLPRLVTSVPEDNTEWIHELKFDGYRIQAHLKNGLGQFFTRNSLEWGNKFPNLLNAIEKIPVSNAVFDGEIVALDSKGRTDFQKLQNSLKSKNDKHLRYYVFDLLFLNGKDLRNEPLIERKSLLKEILKNAPKEIIFSDHLIEEGKGFFEVSCENELEGIVSKLADSPYRSGRNDLWVKTKCINRQEFVIGGWTDPKGGRSGLGALLLGIYENHQFKYVGRVGSGLSHKLLREIYNELSPLERKKSPFKINSPKGEDVHWVKPNKVCEVSFSNWTDEGVLRTPVFIGLREDKKAESIHMENAKEVKEISSPDKIIFKKEKKTKGDVLSFYTEISKVMIPYLKDRPLSLVRCPNGSEGECFYQKHIHGNVPKSFKTFPIKEDSGEGIYLAIDSPQGLKDLVQLNAFEIHAWNCHKDDYLLPDQIVMDFDPGPGVSWEKVKEAAILLKDILSDLDLISFVKLTGGKGLHVHIPLAPLYDWDEVKSFAQTLALEMVSRNPSLYTANMAKKKRTKKIFIDYLRNGYGATAVVPYSLRAKPLSAVALPVSWSELRKIEGPQEFTMDKALKKIKSRKKDPWEGMLELKQEVLILEAVSEKKKSA